MTPGPLFSRVCSLRAGRWMHDPARSGRLLVVHVHHAIAVEHVDHLVIKVIVGRCGADRDVTDELRRRGAPAVGVEDDPERALARSPTAPARRPAARASSRRSRAAAASGSCSATATEHESSRRVVLELVARPRAAAARRSRARARDARRRRSACRARSSTNSSSSAAPVWRSHAAAAHAAQHAQRERRAADRVASMTSRTAAASLPTRCSGTDDAVAHDAAHGVALPSLRRPHAVAKRRPLTRAYGHPTPPVCVRP